MRQMPGMRRRLGIAETYGSGWGRDGQWTDNLGEGKAEVKGPASESCHQAGLRTGADDASNTRVIGPNDANPMAPM
jgi:hypothetical protein